MRVESTNAIYKVQAVLIRTEVMFANAFLDTLEMEKPVEVFMKNVFLVLSVSMVSYFEISKSGLDFKYDMYNCIFHHTKYCVKYRKELLHFLKKHAC